jgi:hypothetical protein
MGAMAGLLLCRQYPPDKRVHGIPNDIKAMKIALSLLLFISLAGSAFADLGPPSIVSEGFNAYFRYGGKAAMEVWLRGSQLQGDALNGRLAAIEQSYGRMTGSEVIRLVPFSPSFLRVYLLIKYEKGPGFVWFDCYKPDTTWIVSAMNCETSPPILP